MPQTWAAIFEWPQCSGVHQTPQSGLFSERQPIFLRIERKHSKEFFFYGDSRHPNAPGHDHQA
jgi:hypothetical protein